MSNLRNKILLVDDDPGMLRLLQKWLETAEYDVAISSDGREAKNLILKNPPDILITDWVMPGCDGLQLIRWLREQDFPHYLHAMILSVRCGKADVLQVFNAGADDYLKKPVDRDELFARLWSARHVMQLESKLNELARCDRLTGLLHRQTFLKQLAVEWARGTRYPIPMSMALLQLQRSDKPGKAFYDRRLDGIVSQIADKLRENTRSSDLLSRLDSSTFALLLTETPELGARQWQRRFEQKLSFEWQNLVETVGLPLTFQLGVQEREAGMKSESEFLALTEQLLCQRENAISGIPTGDIPFKAEDFGPTTAGEMFEQLRARDFMQPIFATVQPGMSWGRIMATFQRFDCSELPVVDKTGAFLGMVTEQQLMSAPLFEQWSNAVFQLSNQQQDQSFFEDSHALEVYGYFCRNSARGVVVLRNNRPHGWISRRAMLQRFKSPVQHLPTTQTVSVEAGSEPTYQAI